LKVYCNPFMKKEKTNPKSEANAHAPHLNPLPSGERGGVRGVYFKYLFLPSDF
jgi:hypothetical protein